MVKYFVSDDNKKLISYEEGKSVKRYDFDKKEWVNDFKASQIFGKMCIGSIDSNSITKEEVEKLLK